MIIVPFVAGGTTLVLAVVAYGAWLRALPRTICPRCGEETVPVSSRMIGPLDRWIRQRWCSACSWTGWGRNGPMHLPERGPVADGSGFRWGEDRFGSDLGFRFAAGERAHPSANHPSGFRWRRDAGAARPRGR